jgi:hypothetical protein
VVLKWGTDFGEPIAVLRLEPDQLARRGDIKFRRGYDDLDELRVARIRTSGGGRFALLRHVNAPEPGTEVVALIQPTNVSRDIASVLALLELTNDDVTWRRRAATRSSRGRTRSKTKHVGKKAALTAGKGVNRFTRASRRTAAAPKARRARKGAKRSALKKARAAIH